MPNLRLLKKRGYKYICGVDEAGRGPLAGPLSLSFFLISIDDHNKVLGPLLKLGLNDSKKLTEQKREELFFHLEGGKYKNSMISASQIDRHGISKCMQILINRLLKRISTSNVDLISLEKVYFLLDGAIKFPEGIDHEVIIKGDSKEPTIMAASITAKVLRDRKMKQMALKFPTYGFEVHKGYGTLKHRKAIQKCGLCEEHRKYFCKNV
jgi:ribonuclease HII